MPAKILNDILHYEGCNFLRYRLILSTLSTKPLRVTNIRDTDEEPGLKEHEISLIRLIDKITNGSRIEINESGTNLYYIPGLLEGGELEHDCHPGRGITYYLEVVMILAPFCKNPINIKFTGVTNNTSDPCIDRIKSAGIPIMKRFLMGDNEVTLKINKRGAAPLGGGEVIFKCPVSRHLKSIQLLDKGMVKRVRGTACSIKVSPALANRLVESSKGVLLNFIPDVYIHTDCGKSRSSGYSISLTAETTTGVFYSGETCSPVMTTGSLPCLPEDLGQQASLKLIDEIYRSGCIDSCFQSMTAIFMALSKQNVSKVTFGSLTNAAIQCLQDIRDFFGVTFKIQNVDTEEGSYRAHIASLSCVGNGYSNLSRKVL